MLEANFCKGCGIPINQTKAGGGRLFCSDRCRRNTRYPRHCNNCGIRLAYSGSASTHLCPVCRKGARVVLAPSLGRKRGSAGWESLAYD